DSSDTRRFLRIRSQCYKITRYKKNRKWQVGRCINDRQYNPIVQKETVIEDIFQCRVPSEQHQENRNSNITDIDKQSGFHKSIEELTSQKCEPGQNIRCRQCHDQ